MPHLLSLFHQSKYCWFWRNWNFGKWSSKFPMTFFVGFLPYVGLHSKLSVLHCTAYSWIKTIYLTMKSSYVAPYLYLQTTEECYACYSIQNLTICMNHMTVLRWCNAISVCTAVNTGGLTHAVVKQVVWSMLSTEFPIDECTIMTEEVLQEFCKCLTCYTASVIFIMLVLFWLTNVRSGARFFFYQSIYQYRLMLVNQRHFIFPLDFGFRFHRKCTTKHWIYNWMQSVLAWGNAPFKPPLNKWDWASVCKLQISSYYLGSSCAKHDTPGLLSSHIFETFNSCSFLGNRQYGQLAEADLDIYFCCQAAHSEEWKVFISYK